MTAGFLAHGYLSLSTFPRMFVRSGMTLARHKDIDNPLTVAGAATALIGQDRTVFPISPHDRSLGTVNAR